MKSAYFVWDIVIDSIFWVQIGIDFKRALGKCMKTENRILFPQRIRVKIMLKRLVSAGFFINETSPRFSPIWSTRRKAREILIYRKICEETSRSNTIFTLVCEAPYYFKLRLKPTVDNKKTHPPVFQPFVFPVYLRNRLRYNKSVCIFLHPFLKSFQLEQ